MRQRLLMFLVTAMLGLGAGVGIVTAAPFDGFSGPWTQASATEEERIVDAVRSAHRARAVAARTFDLSGIQASYVDEPSVPLTAGQLTAFAKHAPGRSPAGALTFQLAYFEAWLRGAAAFQRVDAAYKAGKLPAPEDVAIAVPPRSDPIYELPMTVHQVSVSGDRAYVEAETDATYFRVTLVKRADRWLVAGEDNTGKD